MLSYNNNILYELKFKTTGNILFPPQPDRTHVVAPNDGFALRHITSYCFFDFNLYLSFYTTPPVSKYKNEIKIKMFKHRGRQ